MTRFHVDETHRLTVLHDLAILDTPAELAFDDIARLAAASCQSRVAAVNFVAEERHWTKAVVGVEGGQGVSVPAEVSFCAATVAAESGSLSLPDTWDSEGWRSHPLVTGPPHLRHYAGAAIVVSGERVGVVCIYGDEPRELGEREDEALAALARQASAHLELRKRNAELRELAVSDPLTRLPNRTLLFDQLERAIVQRRRGGGHVGVLFCDVDKFKLVNDRRGHAVGDRLLCRIADRLRMATRDSDTVARLAGDEFVVVCPGLETPEELDTIVERVDRLLHEPDPTDPDAVATHLSIGAALLVEEETAAEVLRRADEAMYEAKARGSAVLSSH